MRFAFACSNRIDDPYFWMGQEFCREFTRLGMPMEVYDWAVISPESYFDGVFIADLDSYWKWHKTVSWPRNKRKFTIFQCGEVDAQSGGQMGLAEEEIAKYPGISLVCFTHDWIHETFNLRYGDHHDERTMTLAHGVPFRAIRPPAAPRPQQFADKTNLVFYGDPTERQKDKLQNLGRLLGQDEYRINIINPAGSQPSNWENYLYYADYGLGIIADEGSLKANPAYFTYMAAGLPVVFETGHGDWIVDEMQHGLKAPKNVEEFAITIANNRERTWDRAKCQMRMQEQHTWTHRARQLHKRIVEML